jgi:hypothetical protein
VVISWIWVEELCRTMRNLSLDSQSLDWDLNKWSTKYDIGLLTIQTLIFFSVAITIIIILAVIHLFIHSFIHTFYIISFFCLTGFWKLHLFVTHQPADFGWWNQWHQWHNDDKYCDCWALSSELWQQFYHLPDYYMYHAQPGQFWQDWEYFSELQVRAYKISCIMNSKFKNTF